jgi:glycosyltransferase involved in cell wall biosynthesis
MALPVVETAGVPLLFDTRGLWADEKVDAGEWPADGPMYRATKDVERELFMRADAVTVLTERVRRWLREEYAHRRTLHAPIHVIPTCTDLDHFRPDCAPDRALADRIAADERVLVYVGSIGGRYLPEEMARFYLAWRAAVRARGLRARLLVVSRQRPTRFHTVLRAHGCDGELIAVSADRDQMPALVRCAHAGVLFYRDVPSAIACMPTKLGELLAAGLPFLSNAIADVPRIVEGGDVGLTVDRFDDAALSAAAEALLDLALAPETAVRARARAQRWFALEDAVDAYDALYRSMPASHGRVQPRADASWPRSA